MFTPLACFRGLGFFYRGCHVTSRTKLLLLQLLCHDGLHPETMKQMNSFSLKVLLLGVFITTMRQ